MISYADFENACVDVFINSNQHGFRKLYKEKNKGDRLIETSFTDGIHVFSIWLDMYSHEIGSNIDCYGRMYSTHDIVYICEPSLLKTNTYFAFKDLKTLQDGINLNRIYIEKSLEIINSRGRKIVKKIEELYTHRVQLLEKESKIPNILLQASKEFKNKNWIEAIKLYNLIMPYLSKTNKAKFEYAKLKLSKTNYDHDKNNLDYRTNEEKIKTTMR